MRYIYTLSGLLVLAVLADAQPLPTDPSSVELYKVDNPDPKNCYPVQAGGSGTGFIVHTFPSGDAIYTWRCPPTGNARAIAVHASAKPTLPFPQGPMLRELQRLELLHDSMFMQDQVKNQLSQ
jgi:hypothetical protein